MKYQAKHRFLFLALLLPLISFQALASVVLEAVSSEYLNLGSAICSGFPVSVSAWLKVNDTDNDRWIFWIGDTSVVNQYTVSMWSNGASANDFYKAQSRDATTNSQADTGSITTGTWLHIGGVFASTTSRKVYPNGGTPEEKTDSVSPTGENDTVIGMLGSTAGGGYWDGKLAEIAIWCGDTLTDTDMTNLASGANPQTISGLDAYWPLFTNEDDAIGSNDLTKNGAGITFDSGDHPTIDPYGMNLLMIPPMYFE